MFAAAKQFNWCSSRLDVAAFAFQLHFCDAVVGHAHLREPSGDDVFAAGFHHADHFAFSQVRKTAIAFDVRVLLRRLRELAELVGGEFAGRNGVGAHEFCHNDFLSWLFGLFLVSSPMGEIGLKDFLS